MPSGLCIIGSGYSAAALLLHLEARNTPMDGVVVIGPQALGAGQAFGCVNDDFRLNVRAELMQVWPDDPGHFASWAAKNITTDRDANTDVGAFTAAGILPPILPVKSGKGRHLHRYLTSKPRR